MPQTSFKSEPSLKDLLDLYRKDIFQSIKCQAIATITRFDSSLQTCEATINYKRSYLQTNPDGTVSTYLVDYPILVDMPAVILGGGNAHLTFPPSKLVGSDAIILFNDRDLSSWFEGNNALGVPSRRLHSFADGLALIGVRSKGSKIADYDEDRVLLANGTTGVGIGDSKVKVYNATTTLNTQLQNLATELENLVTLIAAITVTCATPGNPSSIPANAAAIVAVGTQISATATQIAGLLE